MRVLIGSQRLTLVSPDDVELRAIAEGDRDGWAWADDYPPAGDQLMAGLVLARGIAPASSQDPWLPLQVRERATGLAVGGAGFHTAPDESGVVEIGYGLASSARGRGLAREAVGLLIVLAARSGATELIAETDADNVASQRVLLANDFQVTSRTTESIHWRRPLRA